MKKLKSTEMDRLTPEEYLRRDKLPIVVVLDDVRSMNNIGSIFRTADAFRIEALVLCGITATPPHTDIHKTALGAEESVPWRYAHSSLEAVKELRAEGYQVLALEQVHDSLKLDTFIPEPNQGYALVLGNEEIPQFGTKHSLNVSVAAGIALWHMARPLLHTLS